MAFDGCLCRSGPIEKSPITIWSFYVRPTAVCNQSDFGMAPEEQSHISLRSGKPEFHIEIIGFGGHGEVHKVLRRASDQANLSLDTQHRNISGNSLLYSIIHDVLNGSVLQGN
jgi:hypothetical protein